MKNWLSLVSRLSYTKFVGISFALIFTASIYAKPPCSPFMYDELSTNNSSPTLEILKTKAPEELPQVKSKKLVVITGVTGALGRAMLDRFVEYGWLVAGCGFADTRLADTRVKELCEHYDAHHYFQAVDITNAKAVTDWAKETVERFGAPDLLINNISLVNSSGSLWAISEQEFSRIIDVNVNGTCNVIRAFVPSMIKQKHGVIVNISSIYGRTASHDFAPYCASKFAIEGLSQAMAQELPVGLCVVTLDPGSVDIPTRSIDYPPNVEIWSRHAVPFILSIGPKDNGKSLTCPDVFE